MNEAEKLVKVLRGEDKILESSSYLIVSGEPYNQLKQEGYGFGQTGQDSKLVVIGEDDEVLSAPPKFDPDLSYALTDGENFLHVDFDEDGNASTATRYGNNNDEHLIGVFNDVRDEDEMLGDLDLG